MRNGAGCLNKQRKTHQLIRIIGIPPDARTFFKGHYVNNDDRGFKHRAIKWSRYYSATWGVFKRYLALLVTTWVVSPKQE